MLDYQDATNVDKKGLPLTVRIARALYARTDCRGPCLGSNSLRHWSQEGHPTDAHLPRRDRAQLRWDHPVSLAIWFPDAKCSHLAILTIAPWTVRYLSLQLSDPGSCFPSALQLTDKHRVTTPVNWKQGDDVVIHASVSPEDAKRLFPNHVEFRVSFDNKVINRLVGELILHAALPSYDSSAPVSNKLCSLLTQLGGGLWQKPCFVACIITARERNEMFCQSSFTYFRDPSQSPDTCSPANFLGPFQFRADPDEYDYEWTLSIVRQSVTKAQTCCGMHKAPGLATSGLRELYDHETRDPDARRVSNSWRVTGISLYLPRSLTYAFVLPAAHYQVEQRSMASAEGGAYRFFLFYAGFPSNAHNRL